MSRIHARLIPALTSLTLIVGLAGCDEKKDTSAAAPTAEAKKTEVKEAAPAPAEAAPKAEAAAGIEGKTVRFSCNFEGSSCQDLVGSVYADAKQAKESRAQCELGGAKVSDEPCPTRDVVGSCLVFPNLGTEKILRYYAPFPAESAEKACEMAKGQFFKM